MATYVMLVIMWLYTQLYLVEAGTQAYLPRSSLS